MKAQKALLATKLITLSNRQPTAKRNGSVVCQCGHHTTLQSISRHSNTFADSWAILVANETSVSDS